MTKAEHEREVFGAFTAIAELRVDPASIRSQEPPQPDIACTLDGEQVFFELTRAADQEIANDVGRLFGQVKENPAAGVGNAHAYDDQQILRTAVEKKAGKAHETNGRPLELLIYYDGVFHAVGQLSIVEATFRELQAQYRDRWRRMWLYDRVDGKILQ